MSAAANFQSAFSLAGKTALVTGGGSGLGLAIARCMAAAGARVIIAGRRKDVLERAVPAIGNDTEIEQFDLADIESIGTEAKAVINRHGPIDILVNNAGNTIKKPFEQSDMADFDAVFDVHVRGALELTRHIIGPQLEKGSGSILFIASMTSFIGQPMVIGYTMAKTALTGAVRGLSAEFAHRGIRVNAIAPGWIDTALFQAATANDPQRQAKIMGRIQTGTLGEPEDIGWACVYLASPAANYVTGQTLIVDGGGVIGF